MTVPEIIADVVIVGVVLSAAALGLGAHLLWLAATDLHALCDVALMFWEVVAG